MYKLQKIINYFIAIVWLINGLVCKILNLVPRHQQIVARILGNNHDVSITKLIGIAELVMCLWIISGYKQKLSALLQMLIIAGMNILEFFLAKDLLLWKGWNAFFASLFIIIIYLNNFRNKAE